MKYKITRILMMMSLILSNESNDNDLDIYYELYDKIFETFNTNYVDSLDKTKLIKSSLDGMFKSVDPYTKLYIGSSKDRLEILTKGKYGGVGMQIGLIKDTLTVLSPYEDSPSYSEGIQAGDQILMVDTTSIIGLSATESSNLIRGEVDSQILLKIRRPHTNEKIDFNLTRASITIKDVPYSGVDKKGVGYIRIKKFSKNTARDFRRSLKEILSNKTTKGLVIDLRGNTGGLLSNALNILDQLVPIGEEILTTKGKTDKSNRSFKAKYKPKIPNNFPMVVLINRSSASASEIVSGTLQDLDLAIILGSTSFGKGLVQRIYNINDTISLKVTTSKYYIPSGRLIQKIDYLDNDILTDGLDDRDSLFYTKNGRIVKGGGGIKPDIETIKEEVPLLVQALYRDRVFLKFCSEYIHKKGLIHPIKMNNEIINDFIKFSKNFNVQYMLPGEKELRALKEDLDANYLQEDKKIVSSNRYPGNSYAIVDADRWLTIRNSSGKVIKVIPPQKHKYNTGEYYYNKLGQISPKTKANDLQNSDYSYMTKNIERFFEKMKLLEYNDAMNIKWIENALLRELSLISGGEKEKIKVSLYNDKEYLEAVELIIDENKYKKILQPNKN